MSIEKVPLFVRLPKQQIAALDRLAYQTGRAKQHVLSELLADRLASVALPVGRVDVANAPDVTGDDVLTLEEAATLFKLSPDAILTAVEHRDLPGRRFGEDWRFSRVALLTWLARGKRGKSRNPGSTKL
jgi:excisionase family DNA binding protein